ncbi:MAG: Ohr family peroxiredoxin [Salegentibacter sp.]
MKTLHTTRVTTTGGKNGHVESEDGILDLDLAKSGSKATNPEELFAAAYSASFARALEEVAENSEFDLEDMKVTAEVSLSKNEDEELQLSVVLDVYLPDTDVDAGEEIINEAYENCPFSLALEDNVDVTLNLLIDD